MNRSKQKFYERSFLNPNSVRKRISNKFSDVVFRILNKLKEANETTILDLRFSAKSLLSEH